VNVVVVQHEPESALFVHHFLGAGSQAGQVAAHRLVVLMEEDVAANEMWQETGDGQTDGLQFLLSV
jgi:uncharacterized protein (DUF2126 family)